LNFFFHFFLSSIFLFDEKVFNTAAVISKRAVGIKNNPIEKILKNENKRTKIELDQSTILLALFFQNKVQKPKMEKTTGIKRGISPPQPFTSIKD